MKSNYHIANPGPQSASPGRPVTGAGRPFGASPRTKLSPGALRIPVAVMPSRPLLVGDRDMLRKLRASEMAAWESFRPPTGTTANPEFKKKEASNEQSATAHQAQATGFVLLLLASLGIVAVSLDRQDLPLLLAGWSQLVSGIRNLFA